MQKGFFTVLVLSIIIGVFAISNSAVVTIDFIFTEVELSQAIVIFICVLLGAILATIFGYVRQVSLKKNIKQLKKENEMVKDESNELKLQVDNLTEQLEGKEDIITDSDSVPVSFQE